MPGDGTPDCSGRRLVPATRLSDASRASSGRARAVAAAGRTPSPGRDGRFTKPLGVRVGWLGGGGHADGSGSPGAGASKTDLGAATPGSWPCDTVAGSPGPHPGEGVGTGLEGQGGCGSGAGDGGNAGPPPGRATPDGRMPWGGVTGALVTASVVSRAGGMWTVAVMPLPGEWSSRTVIPWRAARLPAT
jgi:hypothetical protein